MTCNQVEDQSINNISEECSETESIFKHLYKHPTLDIELNCYSEERLILQIKENEESLIHIDEEELYTYDNIPAVIEYLQDVYNYATHLRNNLVEYVDFKTARDHMNKGNKAKLEGAVYGIRMSELIEYRHDTFNYTDINLRMLDSDKWILL